MKNRHLLVLIASVLFSGQLAIAKEDKPTPTEQLFAAVENSKTTPEALSILIKAGAEVNARDKTGRKAIDYAKSNFHLKDTDVYWKLHDASFE